MVARNGQKERTRRALLAAAGELLREGHEPSIPKAAERALVSVATAYRYFSSPEALWEEAGLERWWGNRDPGGAEEAVRDAGDDVQARMTALIEAFGYMLDEEAVFRRLVQMAQERWFEQQRLPEEERTPVRQGRRRVPVAAVVEPLRREVDEQDVERIANALMLTFGSDSISVLRDICGLDVDSAKRTQADAARWLLAGALAELGRQGGRSQSA